MSTMTGSFEESRKQAVAETRRETDRSFTFFGIVGTIFDTILRMLGADRFLDDGLSTCDIHTYGIGTGRTPIREWGSVDGERDTLR